MKQTENMETQTVAYKITATLLPRNILQVQLRSYSVHEDSMETNSDLQILEIQASLKHENFAVSYHNYTKLLPQNILPLQLHFSCTLYSINNSRFTKI